MPSVIRLAPKALPPMGLSGNALFILNSWVIAVYTQVKVEITSMVRRGIEGGQVM
jgi:hypothetical protein